MISRTLGSRLKKHCRKTFEIEGEFCMMFRRIKSDIVLTRKGRSSSLGTLTSHVM
jgi:hypothetical protein